LPGEEHKRQRFAADGTGIVAMEHYQKQPFWQLTDPHDHR